MLKSAYKNTNMNLRENNKSEQPPPSTHPKKHPQTCSGCFAGFGFQHGWCPCLQFATLDWRLIVHLDHFFHCNQHREQCWEDCTTTSLTINLNNFFHWKLEREYCSRQGSVGQCQSSVIQCQSSVMLFHAVSKQCHTVSKQCHVSGKTVSYSVKAMSCQCQSSVMQHQSSVMQC